MIVLKSEKFLSSLYFNLANVLVVDQVSTFLCHPPASVLKCCTVYINIHYLRYGSYVTSVQNLYVKTVLSSLLCLSDCL